MPLTSWPVWQNGTPQSMHREPCSRSFACSMWKWNSFQSTMRSAGERSCGSSRKYSMNPVGLPIFQLSVVQPKLKSTTADASHVAGVLLERGHHRVLAAQALRLHLL